MADLQYKIGLDGSQADATISRVTGGVGRLGAALGALGVTAFGAGFLKRGLDFNRTMHDSEAAIAKVLAQFQGLNDEAAKGEAAKAMAQLVALEPKAAGTLNTLVDGFLATLAASQSAGISVAQNIDLVGRFANALANANIPTEQLAQEMRSILTANIGADSTLAKVLGITTETARAALESGRMYDFLVQKIGKLGEAGDTAAVAFSSLESALDKAAGALAAPLFEQVLAGAKDFTVVVEDLTPQLERLGGGIGQLVVWAKDAAAAFTDFGTAIGVTAATYVAMFRDGLDFDTALERSLENLRQLEQARMDDAEAARLQANELKKTGEAAVAASKKEQLAVDQAAAARASAKAATKAAGLDKPGASGGGETGGDPFADTERTIEAQRRLEELKRRAAMEQMSTGQKAGLLSAELSNLAKEEATARSDPFGGSEERLIEIETKRIELQREINELKRQEARETQRASEAASRATEAAAPEGGRRRIRGFSRGRDRARLMGSPGGGGLDKFWRDQGEASDFERLQQQPFGADGLSTRAAVAGTASRVSRLMGQASAIPLSERAAQRVGAAVMPAAANEGKAAQTADPVPGKLDKILSELTRIRTA